MILNGRWGWPSHGESDTIAADLEGPDDASRQYAATIVEDETGLKALGKWTAAAAFLHFLERGCSSPPGHRSAVMAKITEYRGYHLDEPPSVPRPESPVDPVIVSVKDGLPLVFPGCHGVAVRVVHPTNTKALSKNMSLTMFYLPPHVLNEVGSHPTEETYVILEGLGEMTFTRFKREVKKGDFIHLPSWCEHGIENTGDEMLVVLVVTSPPNP